MPKCAVISSHYGWLPRAGGGGWKKMCTWKKLHTPPPPPSRGCLRKKSCRAIIVAFGKMFTQGQFLVQKWNSLHHFSLHMACTELFEPANRHTLSAFMAPPPPCTHTHAHTTIPFGAHVQPI